MRYRFCSSCTEEMDRQLREDESAPEEMQGYNCIMIYSPDKSRLLFCKRLKEPYEGKFNLVGGKIEPGEDHFDAAYRELFEETGISRSDVTLSHMMDFTYYNQHCIVCRRAQRGRGACQREASALLDRRGRGFLRPREIRR